MSERIQNAAREYLAATGYGDAAGAPVETKNAAEIAERYGYVTKLMPIYDNPYFPGRLCEGTTTDDTSLKAAVTKAIVKARGFTLESQKHTHVIAYDTTPKITTTKGVKVRGWGGSTTKAVQAMINGIAPEYSGQLGASGNGVGMKVDALTIMQALMSVNHAERYDQYDQLTTMTHDSDIARLTTRVHGDAVTAALYGGLDAIPNAVRRSLGDNHSDDFPDECALILRAVEQPCQSFEALVNRYASGKNGKDYGFYIPETLAIVYDVVLGSNGNFETAVYRAVNLGGDADSTASMAASMIACARGGDYEKPHDFHKVQDLDSLYVLSGKLASLALS